MSGKKVRWSEQVKKLPYLDEDASEAQTDSGNLADNTTSTLDGLPGCMLDNTCLRWNPIDMYSEDQVLTILEGYTLKNEGEGKTKEGFWFDNLIELLGIRRTKENFSEEDPGLPFGTDFGMSSDIDTHSRGENGGARESAAARSSRALTKGTTGFRQEPRASLSSDNHGMAVASMLCDSAEKLGKNDFMSRREKREERLPTFPTLSGDKKEEEERLFDNQMRSSVPLLAFQKTKIWYPMSLKLDNLLHYSPQCIRPQQLIKKLLNNKNPR
ncbi:hypothetical protein LAZ67_15000462 [Cordylochernes scorpioides]|uniref:Uncharacterized protein n=1 Tax=Cordylochernes scorpioides TaxID=51811 RepID=A0ABY6LCW1_9ARAC|nr:hypothetical protein LAZ67_15000462 [Cordylochernes scorpioides]